MRDLVRQDFAIDLVTLEPIDHGADRLAQLWRGVDTAANPYAVKLSGGGSAAGLLVTDHLARHGVPGVAAPVSTLDGRLWSEHAGRRLSIVPWVGDRRAVGNELTAAHWRSFGELLARVHATPSLPGLPREEYALTFDGTLIFPDPGDELTHALAGIWVTAEPKVAALLARPVPSASTDFVVCHADPHLGNVLLDGDTEVWLIDWDDAILAPREADLMFILGGFGSLSPATEEQRQWFFDGYGEVEIDQEQLSYYRTTRGLWDVLDWARAVLDLGSAQPDRAEALDIVRGILSPGGLVTLALS